VNLVADSVKILGLLRQSGALGLTASEIAGWTGKTLTVVESQLKSLRRQGLVKRTTQTRLTKGIQAAIYQLPEAA
jgi:DNA-binding IclR family transcriptional regulator